MSRLSRIIAIGMLGFLGLYLLIHALTTRIPVRTIGVRQQLVGSSGVEPHDFGMGYALGIFLYHKWHFLDAATHFLDFSAKGEEVNEGTSYGILSSSRGKTYRRSTALEIRTKDDNTTVIDVTVPYRIIPGRGHRLVQEGLKDAYPERVKSTVESVLREELAKMSSEELYLTDKRMASIKAALPLLNRSLDQFHVEALDILVRQVTFPQGYEDKLQEKQYIKQKAKLDGAMTSQAEEQKKTSTIEKQIVAAEKTLQEEWEKRLQEKKSEYEVTIATIRGETELYDRRVRSEADANYEIAAAKGRLALDQAEALRIELRNKVLNTEGGRILVALKAAENLQLGQVTLNSNDPRVPLLFDLDTLTRMLMGGGR